jgi:adenylate kinase
MVEELIDSLPADAKVMFDGFPRTLEQARDLDRLLENRHPRRQIGKVLLLKVPREELIRRIVARSRSEGRADDTPEVMARRFDVYDEQTQPVVDFYKRKGLVTEIDGTGDIDAVTARLMEAARKW